MEGRLQIDVQDGVPDVVVQVVEGLVTGDAGVVDDDVDFAELLGGGRHQAAGLLELDRVLRGDEDLPACLLHRLRGLLGGVGIDVVHHDGRSLPREQDGGGPADAPAAPGDDGDLAVETSHVRRTSSIGHGKGSGG